MFSEMVTLITINGRNQSIQHKIISVLRTGQQMTGCSKVNDMTDPYTTGHIETVVLTRMSTERYKKSQIKKNVKKYNYL